MGYCEKVNCAKELTSMEYYVLVLNETVLTLMEKAQESCDLANCSSVLDEKDSYGQET